MFNPIEMRRRMVRERLEKSFDNEIEKAKHQVGEVHPNGKWIWTEWAPGKFDWKSKNGKHHKNGGSTTSAVSKTPEDKGYAEKFKKTMKDASDDVLNKVISGKIQGTDADKHLAKEILDERKSSAEGEKSAKKIIDLLKVSSSKYSDIKKVTAFKTDKGNWAMDYDGANTGLIIGKDHLSEAELKAAGVKIEGVNANKKTDDTDNEFVTSKEFSKNKNAVTEILSGCDFKDDNGSTKYHVKFYALGMDRGSAWMKKSDIESYLRQYHDAKITPIKSNKVTKADPKQDKAAQAAGFKDYEEMSGWQSYVTAKNLLKKPSMKLKSKEADRKELEKQVADYEKNHADVIKRIEAKNGKKKDDIKSLTSSIQDAYSKVYNWIKEDEENGNPHSNGGKKILDYLQNIEGNLKILSQGKASDDDLKKLQDDVKSLSSAWNAVGYGESNLPISKEDVTKLIASNKKKVVDKLNVRKVYYQTLAEKFDKTGKCESTDALIGVYKNNNPSKNVEAARALRKYIMKDLNYRDNSDWTKTLNEYKKQRLNADKAGDRDAYKAYNCAYQAVKDRIAKDAKNKDNA